MTHPNPPIAPPIAKSPPPLPPHRHDGPSPMQRSITLAAGLLLVVSSLHAAEPPATQTLTVLNWNTYHSFDHKKQAQPAAAWIAAQHPDVVALQEVLHFNQADFAQFATAWNHDHAVMLKEHGYPVALTSNAPITVVEKRIAGFQHGFLHAVTHDIHFFVVHFWPRRYRQVQIVADLAQQQFDAGNRVIMLGDFNAHSRHDEAYLRDHGQFGQLVDGVRQFDFQMTDTVTAAGLTDLVHKLSPQSHYTFGSPALIPRWQPDMQAVKAKRSRIDFLYTGPHLTAQARTAQVITTDQTVGQYSDHYPLLATFELSPSP